MSDEAREVQRIISASVRDMLDARPGIARVTGAKASIRTAIAL